LRNGFRCKIRRIIKRDITISGIQAAVQSFIGGRIVGGIRLDFVHVLRFMTKTIPHLFAPYILRFGLLCADSIPGLFIFISRI
jgi:hypothetical protein